MRACVCVCVCVCVCARKGREGGRGNSMSGGGEEGNECVHVMVCVCVHRVDDVRNN